MLHDHCTLIISTNVDWHWMFSGWYNNPVDVTSAYRVTTIGMTASLPHYLILNPPALSLQNTPPLFLPCHFLAPWNLHGWSFPQFSAKKYPPERSWFRFPLEIWAKNASENIFQLKIATKKVPEGHLPLGYLFVCLFVGIKPEKLYSFVRPGREVKPLGVYPPALRTNHVRAHWG